MNLKGALAHIWELSNQVAGEFCCGQAERDELERQTQAAIDRLRADDSHLI